MCNDGHSQSEFYNQYLICPLVIVCRGSTVTASDSINTLNVAILITMNCGMYGHVIFYLSLFEKCALVEHQQWSPSLK